MRPRRMKTLRGANDLLLCMWPFEKNLYAEQGVKAVFVGHPKADSTPTDISEDSVRQFLGLTEKYVVAVLPGDCSSEMSQLGRTFAAAAARLAASFGSIEFVTPLASPHLRPMFEKCLTEAGIADQFTLLDGQPEDAMASADVVLVASGMAALDAALLGRPAIAAYKIPAMKNWILRRLNSAMTSYFALPNLLTATPLVPEFIQEAATPEALAESVAMLLKDPQRRDAIRRSFATLHSELALDVNQRAADAVLELTKNDQDLVASH